MIYDKLRLLRESKKLSQQELSDKLQINRGTYASCEQGKCNPTIDLLKKLSNLYNVSIDYLVDNNTNGKVVYSEEQRGIMNMVVQLNESNTLKAYSYIAGLLAGQG